MGANKLIYLFITVAISGICSCIESNRDVRPILSENENPVLSSMPFNEGAVEADRKTVTPRFIRGRTYTFYNLENLSCLADYTSVQSLDLTLGSYTDIGPLSMFQCLEELEIFNNYNITDISPLGTLTNLKKLTFIGCPNIQSIECLSSLADLKYLRLSYTDQYFKELVALQQLEILDLDAGALPELDVSFIAQLISLKELYLEAVYRDGVKTNIEELKNLVNLERLSISTTLPESVYLSWITDLKKLEFFEVVNNTLDDVSPLLKIPNLVEVSFYCSKVNDLSPLLESKTIKTIWAPLEYPDELRILFGEQGIALRPKADR
jgi:Leucine-rich repeat (LRR) protein